jgi:sodium/hydrogen antiporter
VAYGPVAEHLSEVVVIVALTNAGLRLDRRLSWRGWATTWRLLGIAMPLTIGAIALLAAVLLDLPLAAALLLGAALSPTDPVLAAEVQVGGPGEGSENLEVAEHEPDESTPRGEDEVRFGLTSEAGVNDGLAFPYTNLAIVLTAASGTGAIAEWFAIDVVFKLAVGIVAGAIVGRLLAAAILALPSATATGRALTGVSALAVTFAAYGVAESLGGYGFLATFVAAHVLRHSNADHEYHASLVIFVEQFERLLITIVLLLLGGYVLRELPEHFSLGVAAFAVLVVVMIRPLAGAIALIGGKGTTAERAAVSFFGIRGVGSFYYIAYALNEAEFVDPALLWAATATVSVVSIVVHGVTASVVLNRLDAREQTVHSQS